MYGCCGLSWIVDVDAHVVKAVDMADTVHVVVVVLVIVRCDVFIVTYPM